MKEPLTYEVSKFPVVTNIGQYFVHVMPCEIGYGFEEWKVKIYIKNNKSGIFHREFKKVYTYRTGWYLFDAWAIDLVGLVRKAVRDYEETLIKAEDHPVSIERRKAAEKFDEWDGVIKGESE